MQAPLQSLVACDPDQAVNFLRKLRPGGPWVLTAITPDGTTVTETFIDEPVLRKFVRTRNVDERRNVYYTINPVCRPVTKKPTKADISGGEFLQVDADPDDRESSEAFKARFLPTLRAFTPAASFIVDSGNGINALWRQPQLVDDVFAIENANKALLQAFGAPKGTHNIDRLFRVPGTINWPNAKKRKHGRTPSLASLIEFNDGAHPLSDFPALKEEKTEKRANQAHKAGATELPRRLVTMLHVEGAGAYPSRSEIPTP